LPLYEYPNYDYELTDKISNLEIWQLFRNIYFFYF
jgi:hypothetical protein